MTGLGELIRARLLAHAGTAALLGTRVWPLLMPQEGLTLPAATYMLGTLVETDGSAPLWQETVETTAWAADEAAAQGLAKQMEDALRGYGAVGSTVRLLRMDLTGYQTGYDETVDLWGVTLRWSAWVAR